MIVYSMEELLLDLEEGQDILINLQVREVEDTAVIFGAPPIIDLDT